MNKLNAPNVRKRFVAVGRTIITRRRYTVICNKGFYKKKSLEVHMQRMHIDDKKRSNTKIEAAVAMIDEVDGEISCKECGKICPTRYNAISHISMVHLKVRNFHCDVCDKSFYQKGDLNDHYRLHTKEKPFSCQYCPYTSRKRSMLVTHERAHTNERPFQCPRCPCAFKRSYVLRNHLKYHDGVKEFQCSIETCRKMFTTNAALNYHCKSKHNDSTDADATEPTSNDDYSVGETSTLSQVSQVPAERAIKRRIPKIVYVMPVTPQQFVCQCGETQTMGHILQHCNIHKFNGDMIELNDLTESAVLWLENLAIDI